MGENHPDLANSLNSLSILQEEMGITPRRNRSASRRSELCRLHPGGAPPNYGTCLYNLAGLYLVTEHADKALPLFQEAVAVDDENLGQVFAVGSESQRANFLAGVHIHLDGFLSAVVEHLASSAEAIRTGMELLLRRKGIGAEALAAKRDAVLGGRYPELEPKLRELSDLRHADRPQDSGGPTRIDGPPSAAPARMDGP